MVRSPAIRRSSEVLPDPLGPVTASASPEEASKSTPEKISRPPRTHLTSRPESRILPLYSPLKSLGYRIGNCGYRNAAARLSLWRCHLKDSINPYLMQPPNRTSKPTSPPRLRGFVTLIGYNFQL